MDAAEERLDKLQAYGLIPQERADEICAAWGVPPVKADIKWESKADAQRQGLAWVDSPKGEAVSELALADHLYRELGLDSRTGLRGRGCQCGELVARLLQYLEEKEQLSS